MTDEYDEHWQERELLNEVRGRGKGSRGGKGAWARKHPGMTRSRAPSGEEARKSEVALEMLEANLSKKMTLGSRALLEKFLIQEFQFAPKSFKSVSGFWDAIGSHNNRLMVRRANVAYVRAIVKVYAIWEWVCSGVEMRSHILIMAEKAKIRITPNTDLLSVVARLVIDYDEQKVGPDGRIVTTHNRRALSRDVRAIEALMEVKRWPAHAVLKKYAAEGGGVDEWSRLPVPGRRMLPKWTLAEAEAQKHEQRAKEAKSDSPYSDDDDDWNDGYKKFKWADYGSKPTDWDRKQASRGYDMSAHGVWLNGVLNYFVRELGLLSGEVGMLIVTGDSLEPLSARLQFAGKLGFVKSGELNKDLEVLRMMATRLLCEGAGVQ